MLLAAYDLRRSTADIDLRVDGYLNDVDAMVERFRPVAAVPGVHLEQMISSSAFGGRQWPQ